MLSLNKWTISFLGVFFSCQSVAYGSCGNFPDSPEIFSTQQVNLDMIDEMSELFEVYLENMDQYKSCVLTFLEGIPSDSEDSAEAASIYNELLEAYEESMVTSIERYNFLLENAIEVENNVPSDVEGETEEPSATDD